MFSVHDLLTRWPGLAIDARRGAAVRTLTVRRGAVAGAMDARAHDVDAAMAALWRRDAALWSADAATQKKIANRLGWLDSPALMADSIGRLTSFAAGVKADGFTDVVLLGMGGSSLAPEVLRQVVGIAPGWPAFHMLDSTDPAAVRAADSPVRTTLYLLASKSGTTIEPNSLAAHFQGRLERAGVRWADHFVAITDEGTALSERARAERFRDVFINPSDIGGRYSAASFFGMVPASLMGQDPGGLIGWSIAMLAAAAPDAGSASGNPAASLGLVIGAAARAGRDKLTLVAPPALAAFGLWVEQLIAESTGKQGVGVIPIAGESPGEATGYGEDRMFVRLQPSDAWRQTRREAWGDEAYAATLDALARSGAPVVDIEIPEPAAIGAEFLRWEIATAIIGAMLEINPFDEPNVQQAKDATRVLLDRYKADGRLPQACAGQALPGGIGLELSTSAAAALASDDGTAILTLIAPGDYLAVLAYLGPDEAIARAWQTFRDAVRDRTGAATMFGYGPRYLHSTGQLHKGGPNSGVFVLVSADPAEDLSIPGEAFSFGTLELAQAQGDFNSLQASGRRALHVHLPRQDGALVRRVTEALLARLPAKPSG